MTDVTEKPKRLRPTGRKRRGHSAEAEAEAQAKAEAEAAKPKRAVKAVRQLDPEVFKQVDLMIGSFAQRRFGPVMPKIAEAFFAAAKPGEQNRPELQQAFALYFVYGYRDSQGLRIIDMFSRFGLKLDREQQRVVDACLRACMVVFVLERKNDSNKQLLGRDLLRGLPMTLLDNVAYDALAPGDVMVAYMFPVGDMWRPLGIGTKVARARAQALVQGMNQLAQSQNLSSVAIADLRPAQVFWTAYRLADMNVTARA
jgi:hypothetical protein